MSKDYEKEQLKYDEDRQEDDDRGYNDWKEQVCEWASIAVAEGVVTEKEIRNLDLTELERLLSKIYRTNDV